MKRVLHVWISQGLCNRLRTLFSAMNAAAATDRELLVSWQPDASCGARLDELFVRPPKTTSSMRNKALLRWDDPMKWAHDMDGSETARVLKIQSNGVVMAAAQTSFWMPKLAELRVQPTLLKRVEAVRVRLGNGPKLGLQIRTQPNAHREGLRTSPLSWFVTATEEILAARPQTVVFASCDSRDDEAELTRRFGPRVQFLGEKSGFNTAAGVQDALCDLLLLGDADYLLVSHRSSMGTLARYLQRVEAARSPVQSMGLDWHKQL